MNVLKLPKQRLEEIILEEIQKFKLLTEDRGTSVPAIEKALTDASLLGRIQAGDADEQALDALAAALAPFGPPGSQAPAVPGTGELT